MSASASHASPGPYFQGGSCKVEQLPNRHHDFPVVELKADVYDPQSVTEAVYAVGSASGRNDLVTSETYNGPSALLDMVSNFCFNIHCIS